MILPGNSQSPVGSLALISTLPYLNEKESCVRILALRTGLIIIGTEPVRSHPKNDGFVHLYLMKKNYNIFVTLNCCIEFTEFGLKLWVNLTVVSLIIYSSHQKCIRFECFDYTFNWNKHSNEVRLWPLTKNNTGKSLNNTNSQYLNYSEIVETKTRRWI